MKASPCHLALTSVGLVADVGVGAEIDVAAAGISRDKVGEDLSEVVVENVGEDAAPIAS